MENNIEIIQCTKCGESTKLNLLSYICCDQLCHYKLFAKKQFDDIQNNIETKFIQKHIIQEKTALEKAREYFNINRNELVNSSDFNELGCLYEQAITEKDKIIEELTKYLESSIETIEEMQNLPSLNWLNRAKHIIKKLKGN